ncbi:unnamed protein product [Kluyveromyces dobzhanskii CBS 2104]|uniref:WGS project CCBQ000000000 data, contig 00102 n=1 Tax=Kluyveromyces dobzhanskii CBS 2104 TaxID=1427455 RepID=A0A0A8L778_9SACH|nr:unnamed protein product [Kluyveromyces dobzhanskii CBS 2104]
MTFRNVKEYRADIKHDLNDIEAQKTSSSKKTLTKKLLLIAFQVCVLCFAGNTVLNYSFSSETLRDRSKATPTELAYLQILDDTNYAGKWSEKLTSVPHLAGQGIELVDWTASKFEEYGLTTEVEAFDIYLNYPVGNGLTLLSNGEPIYQANLTEDVLPEDSTTGGDDVVPAFHGYSASGNVTAEYVYVNYGSKEDFDLLEEFGVSLKGRIAIARYGKIFRGLKVKFAQEAGAAGVLIYSDPGDDFFQEAKGDKPYPNGPARNPSSLQRGSVQFLSQFPGDPTTPGRPSQGDDVVRDDPYKSIPKIPSLPVSFKEVKPILEKLNGHGLKGSTIGGDKWVGNLLGFDYWTGPNPKNTINLYNEQKYDIVPIHNVYGTLEGYDPKSGYILVGNHRDAWIKGGASDPNSGTAAMLEIMRSLHNLTQTGWKPRRTIKFASWDGEEYALLGSTEFGEKNGEELKKNLLAYLNVDVAVSGRKLQISSSPFLNNAIKETLPLIDYPLQENLTLEEHFFNHSKINILGSGSDYTVFLEHLGIASLDVGFGATAEDPVYHYHSNYDSFHWMSTMQDPGFKLHNTIAKLLGTLTLRLSEDKIINTKVSDYSIELAKYYHAIEANVPQQWLNITNHRGKPLIDLIHKTNVKLDQLATSGSAFDDYLTDLNKQWDGVDSLPWWNRIKLHFKIVGANFKLFYLERVFLHEEGLKDRPWFKHIIFASGKYTGYEGFALPGLKEALDDTNIKDFVHWNKIFLHTIKGLVDSFDRK